MFNITNHSVLLATSLFALLISTPGFAQNKDKKSDESAEALPPVVVHEGIPYIVVSIIDETNKELEQASIFHNGEFMDNSEFKADDNASRQALEQPNITRRDNRGNNRILNYRIRPETRKEQVLQNAFAKALKRSKLRYAYNLTHEDVPPQKWVPQLNLRLTTWEFKGSGAAECVLDAQFLDATGKIHDLKGAIGFESTDGMTDDDYEMDSYLERSVQYAFEKVFRNIKKERLYREPETPLPATTSKKNKKKQAD